MDRIKLELKKLLGFKIVADEKKLHSPKIGVKPCAVTEDSVSSRPVAAKIGAKVT